MSLALILPALLAGPAAAAELEPVVEATAAISYWRLGLFGVARPGVRVALWEKDGNVLFQGTGIKIQADLLGTPAYGALGGKLVITPIAMVDITAYGAYRYYFGNYSTIVGYPNSGYNYGSDDDVESYIALSNNQTGGGGSYVGGALTLKAKAAGVVVSLTGDLSRWTVDNPGVIGDFYFEREKEVMMAFGGDTLFQGTGVLAYEIDRNAEDGRLARLGLYNTTRFTTEGADFLQRLGPMFQYIGSDGRFTHTVIVQPYLVDRAMPTVPPFAAYAFSFKL